MSGNAKNIPLKLVSSFHEADFTYSFRNDLDNPNDGVERAIALNKFRMMAAIAGIKEYKLLESRGDITIWLRSPNDLFRFNVAKLPTDQVEQEFLQAPPDFDFRKLKRAAVQLQRITDNAGFGNTILFGAIRANKSIMILASSKQAYIALDDYITANKPLFEKFFALQREIPEFDIPAPTESEAVEPNIITDQDQNISGKTYASDRFIHGGATDSTVTPPVGNLSLAKSYTPQKYPHTLDMQIGMDITGPNKAFKETQSYAEYKTFRQPVEIKDRIIHAMALVGVTDFHIETRDAGIKGGFKSKADWQIAAAAIYPHAPLITDFMDCPRNDSPRKIKKKAKRIQTAFHESGTPKTIRFIPNHEEQCVQIYAKSGQDFIHFAASHDGKMKEYLDFYAATSPSYTPSTA